MGFPIFQTFQPISRNFHFLDNLDLDLVDDLDLWLKVTKKNLYNPWYVLDICAKNEGDPTIGIGLGGVRPQTHTQTDKQRTYRYHSVYSVSPSVCLSVCLTVCLLVLERRCAVSKTDKWQTILLYGACAVSWVHVRCTAHAHQGFICLLHGNLIDICQKKFFDIVRCTADGVRCTSVFTDRILSVLVCQYEVDSVPIRHLSV